jgi:hypothetical protein
MKEHVRARLYNKNAKQIAKPSFKPVTKRQTTIKNQRQNVKVVSKSYFRSYLPSYMKNSCNRKVSCNRKIVITCYVALLRLMEENIRCMKPPYVITFN